MVLYSTRERIEFYGELSEIVKQEPRLFQCHRSFVVNPYNISSIQRLEGKIYLKKRFILSSIKAKSYCSKRSS
ncbi:LytTR family transcriptional regulator DNA-binding domain-containing protein [Streptococcus pyogenes]|uniref:LytTR family transcriptional regulator DNA-binding domain-containing protein n=1 Tax=Streptococcus pyogenes TaxID=1314 RepID=UPI001F273D62|nr:LytTR family transcriptional regulator DNA-binding domain-containing protein [Streptococcus pyogenes]